MNKKRYDCNALHVNALILSYLASLYNQIKRIVGAKLMKFHRTNAFYLQRLQML